MGNDHDDAFRSQGYLGIVQVRILRFVAVIVNVVISNVPIRHNVSQDQIVRGGSIGRVGQLVISFRDEDAAGLGLHHSRRASI